MAKTKEKTVDFSERMESVQRQFKNLDTKDPSVWPVLPKVILCIFIAGAVAAVSWFDDHYLVCRMSCLAL